MIDSVEKPPPGLNSLEFGLRILSLPNSGPGLEGLDPGLYAHTLLHLLKV